MQGSNLSILSPDEELALQKAKRRWEEAGRPTYLQSFEIGVRKVERGGETVVEPYRSVKFVGTKVRARCGTVYAIDEHGTVRRDATSRPKGMSPRKFAKLQKEARRSQKRSAAALVDSL